MRIEFEAYGADNFVHDLPGLLLPCGEYDDDEPDKEDNYIHVIEANTDDPEWRRYFQAWIHRVMHEALFVSGDDDYFDYYPGNISAMVGIVDKLKKRDWLRKTAQKALQYAYDVRYYDLEPETIIPLDEVPKYEKRRDKALTQAAETFRIAYWNWRVRNRQ